MIKFWTIAYKERGDSNLYPVYEGNDGKGDRWTLNEQYATIVQRYEEIKTLSEQELQAREDASKSVMELDIESENKRLDQEFEKF